MRTGSFNKQAHLVLQVKAKPVCVSVQPQRGVPKVPWLPFERPWRGCGWSQPGVTGQTHICCEQERGFAQDNGQWAFPHIYDLGTLWIPG